jgi:hypothetical protein
LPAPWQNADLGTTGAAGSADYTAGTFTIRGAGADIWGTADAFQFVYRTLSGNGEIVARVATLQNTDPFAKAGVMIRETLSPGAKNAFTGVTFSNGVTFQVRTATGGTTTSARTTGFAAPYWVKLVRNGNTFTGFRSPNGTTWTQQGSPTTITMATNVFVGLAVTSHKSGTLNTATVDGVTFTSGADTTPPTVSISAPAAGARVSGGAVTVSASASDNVGVAGVQLRLDGANLGSEDTTAPYAVSWNTLASTIGSHSLSAVARDAAGNTTTSAGVAVLVDNPPTNLVATPGNAQVSLRWDAPLGATSFRVKRSLTSGGPYSDVGSPAASPFVDTTAVNGTTYFYVVTAVNGTFETRFSNEASAQPQAGTPPPPPTGLVATPGNNQAMLSWTAAPGAASYNVKRSTTDGSGHTTVGTATVPRFVDTGATNGTRFFYVVTSVNGNGEGNPSAQVDTTPSAATCKTATGGASGAGAWVNTAFTAQAGTFTAEYDATPSALQIDSIVGLSRGAQTAFTGFATLTRFNTSNTIDARNGGAYAAATSISYAANAAVHFRLVINVPSHTYSIFVTRPGMAETTLGSNFAFRTEQASVTSLDTWGVIVNKAGTTLTDRVCNFWIHP